MRLIEVYVDGVIFSRAVLNDERRTGPANRRVIPGDASGHQPYLRRLSIHPAKGRRANETRPVERRAHTARRVLHTAARYYPGGLGRRVYDPKDRRVLARSTRRAHTCGRRKIQWRLPSDFVNRRAPDPLGSGRVGRRGFVMERRRA